MPAVRAYMVLAALGEHGELLASTPTPDESSTPSPAATIEAWVATEHENAALVAAAGAVADVGRRPSVGGVARRRRRRRRPGADEVDAAAAPDAPRPTPSRTGARRTRAKTIAPRPSASTPSGSTS